MRVTALRSKQQWEEARLLYIALKWREENIKIFLFDPTTISHYFDWRPPLSFKFPPSRVWRRPHISHILSSSRVLCNKLGQNTSRVLDYTTLHSATVITHFPASVPPHCSHLREQTILTLHMIHVCKVMSGFKMTCHRWARVPIVPPDWGSGWVWHGMSWGWHRASVNTRVTLHHRLGRGRESESINSLRDSPAFPRPAPAPADVSVITRASPNIPVARVHQKHAGT